MKKLLSLLLMGLIASCSWGKEKSLDAKQIAEAAGTKTTVTPDGVVRIGWPRTDVKLRVDRMRLNPAAGLGSWAAFQATEKGAMVMGDTVVFQDEVDAAMDAAFEGGLEVTALHNHFFFDDPPVYFMHIGGMGDPIKLASGVTKVWDAIKSVRRKSAQPAKSFGGETPKPGKFDVGSLEKILGKKATVNQGIPKFSFARQGMMHHTKVGGSMGLSSWISFSGSDQLAAIAGDFIMTAKEVQPVLRALRKNHIHVVALHNHMVGERPAFYFTHFWAKGKAMDLARAFQAVLDAQHRLSRK